VEGDSQLVVRQMTGQYKVKTDRLKPLHAEALALSKGFDKFEIRCVGRPRSGVLALGLGWHWLVEWAGAVASCSCALKLESWPSLISSIPFRYVQQAHRTRRELPRRRAGQPGVGCGPTYQGVTCTDLD
jgi:hypothetical protein